MVPRVAVCLLCEYLRCFFCNELRVSSPSFNLDFCYPFLALSGKTALAREIARALRARAPKIVAAPELLDRWVGEYSSLNCAQILTSKMKYVLTLRLL